ncbi:hypothetical protein PSECIP111951_02063 [Pseudoalteromonas holothuriae]|uniref:Transposase n=2 Tax=Pseudoalteromonas holothuriae TaxID=2963714 RepID=A0ABN8UQ27_9GAMM|nr:hypothetical protein PSECIP111951_02063 [Pseudoalteromonas sp. CIP111951]
MVTYMDLDTSRKLLALPRRESNSRKRIRLLAVSLFLEGENRTNIAKRLNTARNNVNKWVSNYLSKGLKGLDSRPIQGRPAKLTPSQLELLSAHIIQSVAALNSSRPR